MNRFLKVYKDKELINRYNDIENYEKMTGGWAYHNLSHVKNVVEIVEKLLKYLNYDKLFIEEAKIGAFLHDIGSIEGKENHAYKSFLFTKEYLKRKKIKLKNEEQVLEAIKIHSDGFDTDNIIALSMILADKLDLKSNRITNEGLKIIGNRQYSYIKDVDIKIDNGTLFITFLVDNEFNIKEAEEFYFTKKMFKAIKSFCIKTNLKPVVYLNQREWLKSNYI